VSANNSSNNTINGQLLLTGQSYRNFIQTVHSPFTWIVYKNSLSLYLRYLNISDCETLLQQDPKLIQSQLIEYVIYMKEELKLSRNSIYSRLSAVEKFYETNDIELRWKKIKSYIGHGGKKRSKKDRPYTHVEIANMIEEADQKGKIAILLMFSSGIRVGGLASLKIGDLEKNEKYGIYKIRVYDSEEGEYTTFCSLECSSIIDSYLAYRRLHGERPLKEDSPLIREDFSIDDEIRASRPKFLAVQTMRKMIAHIGVKSGVIERRPVINGRGEIRPVKATHGLRKAFQTTAINAGMSPLYSEILMGHTSGGLALESYLRPSENDLLEGNDKMIGYIGVMDALTISNEFRLTREVQTLRIEKSKMERLEQKMEEYDKVLAQFMDH
jgi:site-specific recombinase XerD